MFFDDVRITPTLKVSELMEKCREQLKCRVSQSQCYRAKHKILRKIEGSEEEQHAKLWDYNEKILRSNPGTSVYIQLKPDEDGMPTNIFQRVVKRREFASTWHDDLGRKIHKRIEKVKQRYGDYYIVPCGNDEFEARSFNGGQHTVNLAMQSCSCRRWELNGIPCEHGAIVIAHNGGQPEDYVNEWYHKHSFLASYNHIMHPMNGSEMWEKSGKPPIIPPEYKRQGGRPRKSRRREQDEPSKNPFRLSKVGVKMTCRRCGTQGHNTRTCKGPMGANPRANVTANPRANSTTNSTASTTPMAVQRTRKRKNATTVTTTQEAPRRTLRSSQLRPSSTQ
ncbi:hypothetical protein Vadar_001962 [Vaccinium darrowii]|uniref:Uncharacterized protein n=1 Tax=Vaccinium darrowii TaxID=229202 RepID=A0ACB7XWQ8_9ERIC|nr:hypothetical protein Vadar_001962 [Vaccinium darrowii]